MSERKTRYRVANPRGIPEGRYVIRTADKVWFEGDAYDGPVTERFLTEGFIEEVPDGKK